MKQTFNEFQLTNLSWNAGGQVLEWVGESSQRTRAGERLFLLDVEHKGTVRRYYTSQVEVVVVPEQGEGGTFTTSSDLIY